MYWSIINRSYDVGYIMKAQVLLDALSSWADIALSPLVVLEYSCTRTNIMEYYVMTMYCDAVRPWR